MVETINLTPRWAVILPTWLMMYRQAVTGDCSNPDVVKENATKEFERMAEAADRYANLVAYLRSPAEGWREDEIVNALEHGKQIRESQDA